MAVYECEYNPLGKIYVDDVAHQTADGLTGIGVMCYGCLNAGAVSMKQGEVVTAGHHAKAKSKVQLKCPHKSKRSH